jgi:hypothetical protein
LGLLRSIVGGWTAISCSEYGTSSSLGEALAGLDGVERYFSNDSRGCRTLGVSPAKPGAFPILQLAEGVIIGKFFIGD